VGVVRWLEELLGVNGKGGSEVGMVTSAEAEFGLRSAEL
jgi:hypothetical protein